MARQSWLDDETQEVMIDDYAQKLSTFIDALADGKIDAGEVKAQEERLADAMKAVESELDDELHAKVTALLCELTAFNLMNMLHEMNEARPKVQFQG